MDSVATAAGESGTVSFNDTSLSDTFSTSFTTAGTKNVGSFFLDEPVENSGNVSVGFHFDLGNDQIDFSAGQTVTQSYSVTVADGQSPSQTVNQTISVSIGGPGNDHFVFAPGVGADTILNFHSQNDTLELDHFANTQTTQELQSLITSDVHGDAIINLGHNDSITLAGVTAPQMQQIIQAGHVLLH